MNDELSNFVKAARSYCALIETLRTAPPKDFYFQLHRALCELAFYGVLLPYAEGTDITEVQPLSMEELASVSRGIQGMTGSASSELMAQEEDEGEKTHHFVLFDHLLGVYGDLKSGLYCFDSDQPFCKEAAHWSWRFEFENHWGDHLFAALSTIHKIRFRLYEP